MASVTVTDEILRDCVRALRPLAVGVDPGDLDRGARPGFYLLASRADWGVR